ncbi:sulfonate ABC transporter substrate-binding protein [Leptolyngbya sp. AN02str]|uniref:sulfonate ABC transporter substrate-binding protein n=1 Tax=Leptolyngbya sp. AN02str TaxID=3423363 RepID=UPI003D313EC9
MSDIRSGWQSTLVATFGQLKRWIQHRVRASVVLFVVGIGMSVAIASCTSSSLPTPFANVSASPVAQTRVVRIGHQKFDPFTLVKARGGLEKRLEALGATVEWTEFQSGPPMLEALNVGSIDIGRTGDAPPVIAQAADAPLVYIGGSAPKDRSSAVIVPPDSTIQSVADLKGKKVAYAKGSSANYLIVRVLETAGLTLADIESVYLTPGDARSAFEQGNVDAWAIWDPFYAAAQQQSNARVLRDSEGLVANRDFYLASTSFAESGADIIQAIAAETQAVAAWADANPEAVVNILSPLLGIEASVLDTVTKRRNYGFEEFNDAMLTEQQQIADTFSKLQLIPKPVNVKDSVWNAK